MKAFTHVMPEQMTVHEGTCSFHETVTVVDPSFFQVIRLPLTEGDPARVLSQPESIVLSQTVASKLFGRADPVGRTVTVSLDHNDSCNGDDISCLDADYPLTVTGVLRDLPHNTQLIADVVMPNTSRADGLSAQREGVRLDGERRRLRLPRVVAECRATGSHRCHRPAPRAVLRLPQVRPDGASESQREIFLDLVSGRSPDERRGKWHAAGRQLGRRPWTFHHCSVDSAGRGCNFMNLATARATLRAREMAVRKVAGAGRRQLIAQFLTEAVVTAVASLAIALSLVEVLLPAFGRFLGEPISLHYRDWRLLVELTAGAVSVGLLSGFYPALVVSALRPADGLTPGASVRSGSGLLRSALVVAQFGISIGLAIAAVVVLRQIDFARHADLGIRRDGVVVIQGIARLSPSQRQSLAGALESNGGIESVAYSGGSPFALHGFFAQLQVPGEPALEAEAINMTPGFPALYGMRLLAGRLLSEDRADDVLEAAGCLVTCSSMPWWHGVSGCRLPRLWACGCGDWAITRRWSGC